MLGLAGETIADTQLAVQASAAGAVCEVGLWAWPRHPNYFFEWCAWIGFAVYCFAFWRARRDRDRQAIILESIFGVTGIAHKKHDRIGRCSLVVQGSSREHAFDSPAENVQGNGAMDLGMLGAKRAGNDGRKKLEGTRTAGSHARARLCSRRSRRSKAGFVYKAEMASYEKRTWWRGHRMTERLTNEGFLEAAVTAAFLIAAADGSASDVEYDALLNRLELLGGVDRDKIDELLTAVAKDVEEAGFEPRIARLGDLITDKEAAEATLMLALAVALADDDVSTEEREVATQLAAGLGVPDLDLDRLLSVLRT
ncbi:MAG: DUF1295 domain-containing protein [Myxococcota bacterium]|nr:DUF1295 domain-containing protein [Myxococcota bacterium]